MRTHRWPLGLVQLHFNIWITREMKSVFWCRESDFKVKNGKKMRSAGHQGPKRAFLSKLFHFQPFWLFCRTYNDTTHPKSIQNCSVGCQKAPNRAFLQRFNILVASIMVLLGPISSIKKQGYQICSLNFSTRHWEKWRYLSENNGARLLWCGFVCFFLKLF